MRLLAKAMPPVLLAGVFTSALVAAAHCADAAEMRIAGPASIVAPHAHDDDCSIHENAAAAALVNEKFSTGVGESIIRPAALTALLARAPRVMIANADPASPALPLALSSILRI